MSSLTRICFLVSGIQKSQDEKKLFYLKKMSFLFLNFFFLLAKKMSSLTRICFLVSGIQTSQVLGLSPPPFMPDLPILITTGRCVCVCVCVCVFVCVIYIYIYIYILYIYIYDIYI